ncbi:polyprenyl synthetase family protein [Agromyces sp. NPDC058136]|uniref:polyprenyl synthetase family protein n=1 Tax=Agromyces sp. NPDC058136 TaxID=3346354 RepID=UPI0036D8FB9B
MQPGTVTHAGTDSAGAPAAAGPLAPATPLQAAVDDFALDAPEFTAAQWRRVRARANDAGPAVAELIDRAQASDGGKHMRPRLVAAAYLGLGGDDRTLLAEVAAAQQLIHLGLCMHDDIIDGDRVRHGRPNLIGHYTEAGRADGVGASTAERQATAAALLAGDLALNTALVSLLGAPAPLEVRHALATEAGEALERTIVGEMLDVRSEVIPPHRAQPLRVAELKTAAYSVALPLRLGAIASGRATAQQLACLQHVGLAFGIAYQLADDDLGLFGSSAATGKSVLSDVQQGKRTEHIRIAYTRAGVADRAALDAVLGDPGASEADAAVVREIVLRTGAREEVSRTIDRHASLGIRLAAGALPDPLATYLADLARHMRGRTS